MPSYDIQKRNRKYYKYNEEPNAVTVGTFASVIDNVAVGFSKTQYLVLPENFDVTDGSSWEMVYKITTGTDVSTLQTITGSNYYTGDPVTTQISSTKFKLTPHRGTSTVIFDKTGTYVIQPNTTYWVRVAFSGTTYTLDYSLDGIEYINDISVASSYTVHAQPFTIGIQCASSNKAFAYPFLGIVYLDDCYININNARWWDVTKGYTRVGSWFYKGTVGSFTTANYLKIRKAFRPYSSNWESVIKFTTGTDVATQQGLLGGASGTYEPEFCTIYTSKFYLRLSSNGSSWNICDKAGTYAVQPNTTYWVRTKFDGSKYTLEYSLDGKEYIEDIYVESDLAIEDNLDLTQIGLRISNPFLGVIDLNESYIKIDDKIWWYGVKSDEVKEATYAPWTRPNLTSNGVMGGTSFAVSASSVYDSDHPAWGAFNGAGNQWESSNSIKPPHWIAFYNPDKLVVSKLDIENGNNSYLKTAIFQGSDDYVEWKDIQKITNEVGVLQSWSVDITKDSGYNYHRLYITEVSNGTYVDINEIGITAEKIVGEPDKYVDWVQPVLTADGTLGGDSFACFAGTNYSSNPAYLAFDGNTTTAWASNLTNAQDFIGFYNPKPIRVKNIKYTNYEWVVGSWEVYGSNNNIDYELLAEGENTESANGLSWDMDLSSNNNAFKYYKIKCLTTIKGQRVGAAEIKITAQELQKGFSGITDFGGDRYYKELPETTYYKYSDKINAIPVGSFARIDKGVARGFSTSQTLQVPNTFNPENNPWEFVTKFNLANNTTDQRIFGSHGNIYGLAIQVDTSGKLDLYASTNGSSFNLMLYKKGTTTLAVNTDYWLKFEYTGSAYVTSLSTDGKEWTVEASVDSTSRLYNFGTAYIGSNLTAYGFDGSIDLNESYININGERWWSGDNYTKVGSWIEGGVASGFTTANYLAYTKDIVTPNTFEQVVKIKTGSNTTTAQSITSTSGAGDKQSLGTLQIYNNLLRLYSTKAGSTSNNDLINGVTSSLTVAPDTTYWLKYHFDGVEYKVDVSEDGIIYENYITVQNSALAGFKGIVSFGIDSYANNTPFLGSIDFKDSYLDINDSRWWSGTKVEEVPESEITDFGDATYYKKVTVTKYWKEMDWTQPINPEGITATSGWTNPANAFDGNNDTYATCGTRTDYIEWDLGADILLSGISAVGQFVSGAAECCNIIVTSVDSRGVETVIGKTTGTSQSSNYNISVAFTAKVVNKLRFYLTDGDSASQPPTTAAKTRIREITLNASKELIEGTPEDYTYTTEELTTVEVSADDEYDYFIAGESSSQYDYRVVVIVNKEVTADDDFDYVIYVPSTQFDYYIELENFYNVVKNKKDYYVYTTEPNAYIIGTFAEINKGIAKGFSNTSYLKLPYTFSPTSADTWEFVTSFELTEKDKKQSIFGTNVQYDGAAVYVNANNLLEVYLSSNGTAWNIANAVVGTAQLETGVKYQVKLKYDKQQYIVFISANKGEFVKDIVVDNKDTIFGSPYAFGAGISTNTAGEQISGIIDLNESYIKINGEEWWSKTYTRVGSWSDDGIATGFSDTNYLTPPHSFNVSDGYTWEKVFKFTTSENVSTQQSIIGCTTASKGSIVQINATKFRLYVSSASSWDIASNVSGTYVVLPNTTYYIKLEFTGEAYNLYYSLDGKEYILDITVASTKVMSEDRVKIGDTQASAQYFLGAIDFNESYMSINNNVWWKGIQAKEIAPKYYKEEVVTSYIKEVTVLSHKLEYTCYGGPTSGYYYAKTPIDNDMSVYTNKAGVNTAATSIDDLEYSGSGYLALSEDSATVNILSGITFPRYYEGDVYKEVIVTEKLEGTPDDYTYIEEEVLKEEVKESDNWDSTNYDYYVEKVIPHNIMYKTYNIISQVFNVSDEIQEYIVPEDVYLLDVLCVASAGQGTYAGSGGGVKCNLPVKPGQTLYITVGPRPTVVNTAVYNASDIRIDGIEYENRIIVAGGGGSGRTAKGGAGGGLIGGNAVGVSYQAGAFGGTQEAGGGASYRSGGNTDGWAAGAAGTYAMGGNGARGSMYGGTVLGGCGGAGYYGGGGGGVYDINKVGISYAGGGGGSSYADETKCLNVTHFQGVNNKDGYIKLSYTREIPR